LNVYDYKFQGASRHDISKSGIYVMIMAMCDETSLPVVIDGFIESIDPCKFIANTALFELHDEHTHTLLKRFSLLICYTFACLFSSDPPYL